MKCVGDLHVHSKYSRATSASMDLDGMARWAKLKGIDVVGTGDFTHPLWLKELEEKLTPLGNGLFAYDGTKFMLTAEVSNVYQAGARLRKVHQCICSPSFDVARQINEGLGKGGRLGADGRPTLSLSAPETVETVIGASKENFIFPSHAWTPWFGVFGSKSGFDSLEECYGDTLRHVHAIETGLSSDPEMNWRLSALDKYALVSNSDAHSPQKLGREANVFDLDEITYEKIIDAIRMKDRNKFLLTYEFFPQEGKYHADGHRNCGILYEPSESKSHNNICPVCRKPLTVGVLHRVDDLADRKQGYTPKDAIPFERIIPLQEIISKCLGKGIGAGDVVSEYFRIVRYFGNEFNALHAKEDQLLIAAGKNIAKGIANAQAGKVRITPGYDGVYGEIEIEGIEGKKETQRKLGDF